VDDRETDGLSSVDDKDVEKSFDELDRRESRRLALFLRMEAGAHMV
jgi:hypothetical protein